MFDLEEEFRQGIEVLLPQLCRQALRLTRNSEKANDLVQATVLHALEQEASFFPGTDLGAWLRLLMRNLFFSEWRKRGREVEDPDELLTHGIIGADNPEEALLAKDQLSFLALLPDTFATPLALAAKGLSQEEIARQLNLAEGTVKSRISRGRRLLLLLIEEEN